MTSRTRRATTRPRSTGDRAGVIVAVLALGGAITSLVQTLVVPLIPRFPALLDASAADITWLVSATLLVGAISNPVAGRLSDRYSKRLVLIGCLIPAFVGAVICALSTTLLPVVIGRGLQGIGMAIIPVGIAAMKEYVPPSRLPTAVALMSSSLGVGGALGLPLAAVMSELFQWQVLFWVTSALFAAVIIAYLVVLPREPINGETPSRPATPAKPAHGFDVLGAVLLGAGISGLLLSITRAESWGLFSLPTIGVLSGSVLVLLAWGWWETRVPAPLVNLRLAANRTVLLTNLTGIAVGYAMYVESLALPQLLTLPVETGHGHGLSLTTMALVMLPSGLAMPLVAPLGGRITATRGPRATLILGGLILVAGYGLTIIFLGSVPGLMIGAAVIGAAVGLAYGAMPTLIMDSVPHTDTGSANSFNAVMRTLGLATAATVTGAILAASATRVDGVAAASKGGFVAVLAIAGAVALLGVLLSWFLPRERASDRHRPDKTTRPG